jgi:hypothetical protein
VLFALILRAFLGWIAICLYSKPSSLFCIAGFWLLLDIEEIDIYTSVLPTSPQQDERPRLFRTQTAHSFTRTYRAGTAHPFTRTYRDDRARIHQAQTPTLYRSETSPHPPSPSRSNRCFSPLPSRRLHPPRQFMVYPQLYWAGTDGSGKTILSS